MKFLPSGFGTANTDANRRTVEAIRKFRKNDDIRTT